MPRVYYGRCYFLLRSMHTIGKLRTSPDSVGEVADVLQS
jgi:hypothetical protein